MSLRIKLPAKTPELDSRSQPSGSELPSNRRKRPKRPLLVDSDDEDDSQSLRHSSRDPDSPPVVRSKAHSHTDDAMSGSEAEAVTVTDSDSRFLHQKATHLSSSKSIAKQSKSKAANHKAPQTKKRRFMVSEFDSEEDYEDVADETIIVDEVEDYEDQSHRPVKSKSRMKPPGNSTKESEMLEEKKFHTGKTQSTDSNSLVGSKQSRPRRPTTLEEMPADIMGDTAPTPNGPVSRSPSQLREASPAPPKKRKLPTIKKNKASNSVGPATPSNPPVSSKSTASASFVKHDQPPTTTVRKTPATIGSTDFDLRNASVYRELFKTAGGSTPRSGLNRREKDEERRKELNKMRDEARAVRAQEAKQSFDLQGQLEKISRFEERLRRDHSSALYPNFLATKWRELWEREKRRQQKEKEWQENKNWPESEAKEEGEMNDKID